MAAPVKGRSSRECVEDRTITGITPQQLAAMGNEFRRCVFMNMDLTGIRLTGTILSECEFTGCNLSLANLSGSSLQTVLFKDCKLSGVRFDQCSTFLFIAGFRNCLLDRAVFSRMKMKKTEFIKCSMKDADMSGCDLTGALFDLCDCERTNFDGAVMDKADLRTAFNFSIDPEKTKLKKALFTSSGIAGLLDKYDIVIE